MPQDQSAVFFNHSGSGGPFPEQIQSRGRVVSGGGGSSHEYGHRENEEPDVPSQVLLVRDLPQYIEEGEVRATAMLFVAMCECLTIYFDDSCQ